MATRIKPKIASSPAKAPGAYHHGNLREALIRATIDLVREGGPASVTLRGVAREAGVSEAAPYHHFRDKTELLAAAAAVSFEALGDRLADAVASQPGDPRAALVSIGVAWVSFALDDPGSFRLLFGAHVEDLAGYEPTRTAGRRTKRIVRDAIRDYAERASLAEDPETLFRALWAQVHGTAWLTLEREFGPSFDRDDAVALARTTVERLLDGFAEGSP